MVTEDLSRLAERLQSADAVERCAAAEQLAGMAEAAAPLAVELVRASGDSDEQVRTWASAALEQLGPPEPTSLPELVLLLSGAADPAYWAATLLGRLGASAASAVPPLAAALTSSPHLNVRERAAWALGQLGPLDATARAALGRAAMEPGRLGRLAQAALEGNG